MVDRRKRNKKKETKKELGRKISIGRRKALKLEQMFEIDRLRKQGLDVLEICQITGLGEGTVVRILREIRKIANSAADLGAGRVSSIGAVVSLATSVIERALEGKPLLSDENRKDFIFTVGRILKSELQGVVLPSFTSGSV